MHARIASAATTRVCKASASSITLRGRKRSVATPPKSIRSARGIACTASTVPSPEALWVRSRVTIASATVWNWSPHSEIVRPAQYTAKLRSASGSSRGMRATRARWLMAGALATMDGCFHIGPLAATGASTNGWAVALDHTG